MDNLRWLYVSHDGLQQWVILLFILVQSFAIVEPEFVVSFIVIQKATLIAKNGHALIFKWNPKRFQVSQINIAPSAKRLGDINVDMNLNAMSTTISRWWGINLFNFVESISYSYNIVFVHTTKREVVNLDPKWSSVKICIIHRFFWTGFV